MMANGWHKFNSGVIMGFTRERVGADGKVKKVWRKVSVTGHAADVMKAAQAL